jgi:multicomponent Na+:H+ antiporter subunit D
VTDTLIALPVMLPLLSAGVLIATPGARRFRQVLSLLVTGAVLATGVVLTVATMDGSVLTQRLGDWPAGIAITLAVDALSAALVTVSALIVLACLAFAVASQDDLDPRFTPLVLILTSGTYGAYLTADLFTLFVLIELMLAPSYALLTIGGRRYRLAAGGLYVTINLLASTTLLIGIGLVYGTAGSVNLGVLAGAAAGSQSVALAAAVVMLGLVVKSAIVPAHGWLPATYPYAPPVVTALLSALLTKLGVYAIMRIYSVVYDGAVQYRWLIMVLALATMLVGVLGAVGERAVRPVLTFHMVSQIGYMILALALFTEFGLAAGVFFMIQYIPVKACLLLVVGAVEAAFGAGRLDRLGGLARHEPMLALAFAGGALALVGVPPLSGFVGKLALVRAAAADGEYIAVAVALVVTLITLVSMVKVWNGVFWGRDREPVGGETRGVVTRTVRPALIAPALALAALGLVLGIAAQPLFAVAEVAGRGLLDPSVYVWAVIGR